MFQTSELAQHCRKYADDTLNYEKLYIMPSEKLKLKSNIPDSDPEWP